jgi:cardiolipin synthase
MTLARLACVPVFLWLLFGKGDRASAAWLLGALGATDFADGYVARHLGQVSELGKLLDPTADRVLLIVGIGSIIVDGDAPRWFALIVLLREGIVALVTLVLFLIVKRRPSDVQWVGKAGTFGLMWAFPLFLMGESTVSWHRVAHWLGWVAGIPALVLSLYAAVAYIPLWRAALVEHRQSRAGVSVLTGGGDR